MYVGGNSSFQKLSLAVGEQRDLRASMGVEAVGDSQLNIENSRALITLRCQDEMQSVEAIRGPSKIRKSEE